MSEYRRYWIPGGAYFFSVVARDRRPIFTESSVRGLLKDAIQSVRKKRPFEIVASVLLPDHLHTIWAMPKGDDDFAMRWMLIKSYVTKRYRAGLTAMKDGGLRPASPPCTSIWQPRYWEHWIRDDDDMKRHLDYIHFNPVKHGLAKMARDWPWSTFQKWVERGEYPPDWGWGEPTDISGMEWDL